MKYILAIITAVTLSGCGAVEQWWSHKKSWMTGLEREATVYSYSGAPIKTWKFDSQVEILSNGSSRFIVNGKAVSVSGGVLIIEEK